MKPDLDSISQAARSFNKYEAAPFHARARGTRFSRSFLRSGKILLQAGAILRNALQNPNAELPSVSNAVQHSENVPNSLGLNYKSAALSGEAAAPKVGKVNEPEPTLYFSERGSAPISSLLTR